MIDSVLVRHNVSLRLKITVKTLVSLAIVALAVLLPQLVHLAAGAQGGMQWLPMYLPVLLGGCLLGWQWGLGVGILSPVVSFALTTLTGNPMPVALRLPYMMAELAVFAAVSGLFSGKIAENGWMAFPAVLLAQVSGRVAFLVIAAIFPGRVPAFRSNGLDADPDGLARHGRSGCRRSLHRHGIASPAHEGLKIR